MTLALASMLVSALLVGLQRSYMDDIDRGEVALMTTEKLVSGLGLTLASLLLKTERDLDNPECK